MDRLQVRFEIVTAGHHFLLHVLPFRRDESAAALQTFVAAARRFRLPAADLEAILLRCLTVLSRHTARVPTLVERYLMNNHTPGDCLQRFSQCIDEALRYTGITDGAVQEVISIVEQDYADVACTPQYVAKRLNIRLTTLDVRFKQQVGATLTEYIRGVRLDTAAALLTNTDKTIKEVWVQVGYNHHSNFDHDFKRRFGTTPRDYRRSTVRPVSQTLFANRPHTTLPGSVDRISIDAARVLIVDDDEGTLQTLGSWLRLQGHLVLLAESGRSGLEALDSISPSVILLDYHLADMDGIQFLRSIRQRMSTNTGVALFTADWEVLDRFSEVADLNALIASKLCDLEQVNDLVAYLHAGVERPSSSGPGSPSNRLPLL